MSDLMSILIFLVIGLLVKFTLWKWNQKHPPGPWGLPIIGYLPFLSPDAPYLTLHNLSKRFGPIFSVQLGQVPCVILTEPNIIRTCLAKREFSGRAPLFLTHGIMGGKGIICAEGNTWRTQRKLTADFMRKYGMIGSKAASRLDSNLLDCVESFVKRLDENPTQNISSGLMDSILSHTLGNMLNEIIFGMRYKEENQVWKRILHLRETGIKELAVAGPVNFLPWIRFVWPKVNSTLSWIIKGKLESHAEYQRISEEVYKDLEDREADNSLDADTLTQAFLLERNRLQKIKHEDEVLFSLEQLNHLQGDIFGAGLDTTLTSLKWVIVSLACKPDIQEKVVEEIDHVLLSCSDNLQLQDYLNKFPYTQAVILEVQRMFPVVPLGVPHGTTSEAVLCDKYELPKGCMVIILHWTMNRDPNLWSSPEDFMPERFLSSDQTEVIVPNHFMPFQVGRRRCVGEDFGKLMLNTHVIEMLRKFRVSLANQSRAYDLNQIHDHGFTLTPKPFEIKLERRQRKLKPGLL